MSEWTGLAEATDVWADLATGLAVRERVPAQKWCDEHGVTTGLTSAIQGRWRTHPYQAEVFKAWDDPEVEEVVLVWGTQLGKSAIWQQLCAYVADVDPGPMLIVASNQDSAREVSQTRVYPQLQSCRRTRHFLPRERDQHDFLVNLRDMLIFFAWSGSPTRLGEKSIRYVIMTELDKFSRESSMEADPEALAGERTKGFPNNHKIYKESTPTVEGSSRIWANYLASDQRQFHVPCPRCEEWLVFTMGTAESVGGLKWEHLEDGSSNKDMARRTAWYVCPHCGGRIEDADRPGMIHRGRWVKKGQRLTKAGTLEGTAENAGRRAGFQLSSFYSLGLSFGQIAEAFVDAKRKGVRALQNFVNSWLAEPWKATVGSPEWAEVRKRLTLPGHQRRRVPGEAVFLTAGADKQENRLYFAIYAWGPHVTGWLVDFGECREIEELQRLVVDVAWPHPGGELMKVSVLGIDARFQGSRVYDWCLQAGARVIPVMGQAKWRAPWTFTKWNPDPDRGGETLTLCNINVSDYKDEIYHSLTNRIAGEAGALNLPEQTTEDFMRQLCGEAKQLTHDKWGREVLDWVVTDRTVGNHYLDATCYAYCLADYLGVRLLHLDESGGAAPEAEAGERREKGWLGETKGWM